jgi:phage terminase small subunit
MLTVRQIRFVDAIAQEDGRSWTRCAVDAGYSEQTAAAIASDNLRKGHVVEAIETRKKELAAAAGLTPEFVLRRLMAIASVDTTKITQRKSTCCRHCHGFEHEYQWERKEYERELNKALNADEPKDAPDASGGFGWDSRLKPSPDCPHCHGDGIQRVWLAETEDLDENTRMAILGYKQTKDGIEVKIADPIPAIERLGKYLGMFVDRSELSGPGGKPLQMQAVSVTDLTKEQLMAVAAGGTGTMLLEATNQQ